ncbi:RNA polymerase sigma-70 factor (ECF subfamily) [Paenibacillus shirakamiensis]|uniref:RNA polymerase sigma-70 factor (ECF subfamily) n=1 Tax=Paenibacillus shirakamiensis TaxID=1265935 RepID=A0ABS4JI61_9BACL|nr:sigma-70 family RNA polymerase sigma factor [Paenibacillus shirakamiensis]MBP2000651.1 RNA polymerase sigma-70 factor (ECF subfamily) [Paenibacillus shirakamiensis]
MDQYGTELLRTSCLLLRDQQAAEEAVQDTFVRAYERIHQLKEPDKLRSWLIRIAVNRCREKQRSWSWRHLFPSSDEVWLTLEEESVAGPEDIVLGMWLKGRLSSLIQELKYIYREALILYYYNEFTVQEIASHLKCNENTVKARLVRGRQQLKTLIEKEELRDGESIR